MGPDAFLDDVLDVFPEHYRYRCTVEGVAAGGSGSTVLHFPDNTVTIGWLGGGNATARFAGNGPEDHHRLHGRWRHPVPVEATRCHRPADAEDVVRLALPNRHAVGVRIGSTRRPPTSRPQD